MSKASKRAASQISQSDESVTEEVVAQAIKAILCLDHLKRPIKFTDILNSGDIRVKRKQQAELWNLVRTDLEKIGMVLTECEGMQQRSFILTQSTPDAAALRKFASIDERADRTLLVLILSFIFMKDGAPTEGEVFSHLTHLDIVPDGSEHEYFGDVKKKIQGKFVEQQYLTRTVLAEQEKIELRWGLRATLEVPKMSILDFVCSVGYDGKADPRNWASQYEKAQI